MSVEVNVVGMRCGAKNGGLSCTYCYEIPLRQANDPIPPLDLPAVARALDHYKQPFSLFGGEPLLAPIETLEALWKLGLERYGQNGVQTGGRPITEEHFALFRKYRVTVSFSIDGPGALNEARRAGSIDETMAATAHSIACLERCLREGIQTGLIVTLSRHNAAESRLPALIEWFRNLDGLGLREVNLHVLEHDGAARAIALSHEQNLAALIMLHKAEIGFPTLRFGLFRDIRALLRGRDVWKWNDGTTGGVSCIWTGCDPFTTPAVQGINADGSRSLCPRVHKGRVAWADAPRGPLVRQTVLRETPQELGGCKGCRQVITCKGQCPGTAEGGDWRRRSRDCQLWKGLLEYFERVLQLAGETPVTLRGDRDEIERRMAAYWTNGRAVSIAGVLSDMAGGAAGPRGSAGAFDHGDHQDHGDHSDMGAVLKNVQGEAVR